ncbi:DUF4190 domain-containing protein [Tautonia rosea]|uniref:DUF4190 domain-containing protein n=1 Tax=Tautonia rosea TaxID=2728037 RepID=UPI0014767D40|nr:DUF4190 domain-containing protein [Tautonia rosea]
MSASWSSTEHAYDPEFEEVPEKLVPHELPTERLAIVSLVAGIAGFFLPVVGPVTAVVSGHVARGEIRKSNGRLGGDALARTGLILGYVWIGLTVLTMLVVLGFTMVLVRGSAEREMAVTEHTFAPAHALESVDRPNVLIQRLNDGQMIIEHGDASISHDSFPKGSIRLHHPGLRRSIEGLPNPPELPELN